MSKVFSIVFFAAVIFAGQQGLFPYSNNSNVAVAAPGNPNEKWKLKMGDNPTILRVFQGNTSSSTDNQFNANVSVSIYPKEGSRPHKLITIVEHEMREQFSGKGKFRCIYTGTFDGSAVRGTYYNNDGESGEFTLTK